MFKNPGGKIKVLAVVLCIVGCIASIICGIFAALDWWLFAGFLDFVVFGIVPAFLIYISSVVMYGFGELVENSAKLKNE